MEETEPDEARAVMPTWEEAQPAVMLKLREDIAATMAAYESLERENAELKERLADLEVWCQIHRSST